MKKLLPFIFIIVALFTGCQKDTSTKNVISPGELSFINSQLTGTWLFPVETVTILDDKGKLVLPKQINASKALQFDGNGNVIVTPTLNTSQLATYSLSASDGFIFITILTPSDGNTTIYKLILVDDKTLKLNVNQPRLIYVNNNPVVYNAIIDIVLRKQDSADLTANTVNVSVSSDSVFNVNLSVVRLTDTVLLNSQSNIKKSYSYSYSPKPADHLLIDVLGSISKTTFSAYYNGLPLGGKFTAKNGKIITTTGWDIP